MKKVVRCQLSVWGQSWASIPILRVLLAAVSRRQRQVAWKKTSSDDAAVKRPSQFEHSTRSGGGVIVALSSVTFVQNRRPSREMTDNGQQTTDHHVRSSPGMRKLTLLSLSLLLTAAVVADEPAKKPLSPPAKTDRKSVV